MIGAYTIEVSNRRVKYQLTLRRNITIIRGDSAVGKTYLLMLITQYNSGVQGAIQVNVTPQNIPCVVATDILWNMGALRNVQNSIIFIDEDTDFIYKNEFVNYIKQSSNYFVFITRHLKPFDQIPYSVQEIYEMQQIMCDTNASVQTYSNKQCIVNTITPLYYYNYTENMVDQVVTEDSKAGFKFFQLVCGDACVTAGGKSRIVNKIRKLHTSKPILVVADGAAFGNELTKIMYLLSKLQLQARVIFYLPESFEWFLLHRLCFLQDIQVCNVLNVPMNYIDSAKYVSWERFFTDFFKYTCERYNFSIKYTKTEVPIELLTQENIQHLLSLLHPITLNCKNNINRK